MCISQVEDARTTLLATQPTAYYCCSSIVVLLCPHRAITIVLRHFFNMVDPLKKRTLVFQEPQKVEAHSIFFFRFSPKSPPIFSDFLHLEDSTARRFTTDLSKDTTTTTILVNNSG